MSPHTNLVRIRAVASALAELNERVVFVGGATTSLYSTDPAAPEPRPTEDIDVVIEVTTYAEFIGQIEGRLRELGFVNDMESSVICRYKVQGLTVDIMPTDSDVLGFSNRWYKEGFINAIVYPISERQAVRILTAPYFIATKFEAFASFRHGRDPRMNSDFEDIIYVFDNRAELYQEIHQSSYSLRSYLQNHLGQLLDSSTIYENIFAHLERNTANQRTKRILTIWQDMVKQGD